MADSPERLRQRIGSAGDLQSVVRAMKAQAAAAVGQYERSVAALGDYADSVELGLAACFRADEGTEHAEPPPRSRPGVAIRAIVFGSDQGLVGRFNDLVVDHARDALARLAAPAQVWAVGDRVRASIVDARLPVLGVFPVPGSVGAIAALIGDILLTVVEESRGRDQAGSVTELHLFYNRTMPGATFGPVGQRLLPLDDAWRQALVRRPWPTGMLPEVLGDAAATRRALVREYLFVSIFRACAESLASENASRLAAMDRADRNIDKMLVTLHDTFHRLRQGRIDEELSDVISGFKALSASTSHPCLSR
jgi:F-type H+-transporting ATPase subunit gamma